MNDNPTTAKEPAWAWSALGKAPPMKKPISMKAKALIQAPVMALAAWALFHFLHHRIVPMIVWTLSGLVLVGGLFVPPIFIGFEKVGVFLTRVVTSVLNWVLLTPFYFLCFVPGRLILLLKGIDPMDRQFPSDKETFWIPHKPAKDMNQYRKQH